MSEALSLASARLFTTDASHLIGTSAVWVISPGQIPSGTRWLRFYNASATGGAIIWLCRNGNVATVGGLGCLRLGYLDSDIQCAPGPVILNAVSAISTAANTALTIEFG